VETGGGAGNVRGKEDISQLKGEEVEKSGSSSMTQEELMKQRGIGRAIISGLGDAHL